MHNSRQPLDRLTVTLTLTLDIIFTGWQGIVIRDGLTIPVPSLVILVSAVLVSGLSC